MNFLDPSVYDQTEEEGAASLPNRILECSKPVHFSHESYPTRVRSTRELLRYVDVMHEGRLEATFADLLGDGVTQEEMALMREVAQVVRDLSREKFGQALVPKDALARSLNMFRQIRFLFPEGNATVFEVGGGCGYLGALLSLTGYTYVVTDITQAFYLYQHHLMNMVAPGKVLELATDPRSISDVKEIPRGWVVHLPWWKFMALEPAFPLAVDVVTANHCLCEMHPRALAYTLKVGTRLLANRGPEGCFLFEGWGAPVVNQEWSVNKEFAIHGLRLAHSDNLATGYVQMDGPLAAGGMSFPRKLRLVEHLRPLRMMRRVLTTKSLRPLPNEVWQPVTWASPANPVSRRLMDGRAKLAGEARYGIEDFRCMLRDVLGNEDIRSGDEKFFDFIGFSH